MTISVHSPYDRRHLRDYPSVDAAGVEAAITRAQAYVREAVMPLPKRIQLLIRLADAIENEKEQFIRLIAEEGGKPVSMARVEVTRAIGGIRYAAAHVGEALCGEVIASGITKASADKQMIMRYEPIGIVVAISAFNHPLNLAVHQMIPAIAMGAPIIMKPALTTPGCALRLIELLEQLGLPQEAAQCVLCSNELAETLATDPRIAFVSFIGSAKVGWNLRSKLSPGTRCALEHGGNAPVILLPYADYETALPSILQGGMAHAGQVCVSVQRVYVPWAEVGALARRMAEAAEKLVVGSPMQDDTIVGPLIHPKEVERIEMWVMEAVGAGAKLMCGGQREAETIFQPTILLDAPADISVSREEIFGPVICVYGYDDLSDAVERANHSRYSFQAAVWGRDLERVNQVVSGLHAATVMVNDNSAFRVDWMPFGGHKQSGLGVGGIPYTMRDYLRHKLVVTQYN